MKLQQLNYVIEISESGSFNKAAQRLFVSQPTLSSAVKELENELGFMIFERSAQGVQVTKEGKEFISSAKQILGQIQHLRTAFKTEEQSETPAVLHVSSGIYSFTTEAIIRLYHSTFEQFPRFSLSVAQTSRSVAIQDVMSRRAEIGIIHVKSSESEFWLRSLKMRGIDAEFLFKSYPCVTFRNEHPLASEPKITREAILAYPQVRLALRTADAYNWDDAPSLPISEEFGQNIYTNNPGTLYDILSNTDSVFLGVTTYCITDFHPNLTTVPVPDDLSSWNIYYIRLSQFPLPPYAQKFVETLKTIVDYDSTIATTL